MYQRLYSSTYPSTLVLLEIRSGQPKIASRSFRLPALVFTMAACFTSSLTGTALQAAVASRRPAAPRTSVVVRAAATSAGRNLWAPGGWPYLDSARSTGPAAQ